jgi:hypothetical protein
MLTINENGMTVIQAIVTTLIQHVIPAMLTTLKKDWLTVIPAIVTTLYFWSNRHSGNCDHPRGKF